MREATQRRDVITLVAVIAISAIVLWLGLELLTQDPGEYCFPYELRLALWSALVCVAGTFIGAAALAAIAAPPTIYLVLVLAFTVVPALSFIVALDSDGVCGDHTSVGSVTTIGSMALILSLVSLVPGWLFGWIARWVAGKLS